MTPAEEVELFRVLSTIPKFRDWLRDKDAELVRYLKASDGIALHRAQGKAALLDQMLDLMNHKK